MTTQMFEPKTCPMRGPKWPHRCSSQKRVQRVVPNDLTDVWAKNLSNVGSQMTSQMFEPKTCLTWGPEWPFRCLDYRAWMPPSIHTARVSSPRGDLVFSFVCLFLFYFPSYFSSICIHVILWTCRFLPSLSADFHGFCPTLLASLPGYLWEFYLWLGEP